MTAERAEEAEVVTWSWSSSRYAEHFINDMGIVLAEAEKIVTDGCKTVSYSWASPPWPPHGRCSKQ